MLFHPGVEGRIILICIFRKWDCGMDWVGLVENRDRLWELVKVGMDHRVP
jgi:hypothetical protein